MQRELITLTVTAIATGDPVMLSMRNQFLEVLDYDDDAMRENCQRWLDAKFGTNECEYQLARYCDDTWR